MKNMNVTTADGVRPAHTHITIRDLFRMTSGLQTGNADSGQDTVRRIMRENGGECPLLRLPDCFAELPLLFDPGTQYNYGISHELLGALVAKISGMSFSEYLKKYIYEPLGMNNTAFRLEDCVSKELATHYDYHPETGDWANLGTQNCLLPPFLKESGTGGIISSVDDYNKFQEALCTGDIILRRSTINLMRQDQLSDKLRDTYDGTAIGWGYGLGVRVYVDPVKCRIPPAEFKPGFTPFGWGGAAGTYGSIDPENEITIFYAQQAFNTASRTDDLHHIIYKHLRKQNSAGPV